MRINGKFVTPPTIAEVFDLFADDLGSKLRVCTTGSIVTYDPARRTASIAIGENLVLNDGTVVPIPAPLTDVPVVTLQGGGVHVGFPIGLGDECLVIFNDFNIDNWFTSGGQQTPADGRQHDLSDGFALVGPNSLRNAMLTALLPGEGGLASATTKVAIDALTGLVTVAKGPANLATALKALITALTALNTGIAAESGTIPTAAAAATAANAALVIVQAQLDALLY